MGEHGCVNSGPLFVIGSGRAERIKWIIVLLAAVAAMKFGKLLRQTVESRMPQWRDHMFDYKTLKHAIKRTLAQGTHSARAPRTAGRHPPTRARPSTRGVRAARPLCQEGRPVGARVAGAHPEDVVAAFTAAADEHVDRVNTFYMERIEEGVILLHALHQHGEQIVRAPSSLPGRAHPPLTHDAATAAAATTRARRRREGRPLSDLWAACCRRLRRRVNRAAVLGVR